MKNKFIRKALLTFALALTLGGLGVPGQMQDKGIPSGNPSAGQEVPPDGSDICPLADLDEITSQ